VGEGEPADEDAGGDDGADAADDVLVQTGGKTDEGGGKAGASGGEANGGAEQGGGGGEKARVVRVWSAVVAPAECCLPTSLQMSRPGPSKVPVGAPVVTLLSLHDRYGNELGAPALTPAQASTVRATLCRAPSPQRPPRREGSASRQASHSKLGSNTAAAATTVAAAVAPTARPFVRPPLAAPPSAAPPAAAELAAAAAGSDAEAAMVAVAGAEGGGTQQQQQQQQQQSGSCTVEVAGGSLRLVAEGVPCGHWRLSLRSDAYGGGAAAQLVHVQPGALEASCCEANGAGLAHATLGKQAAFTIQPCDADGNRRRVAQRAPFRVHVVTAPGLLDASIVQRADGTYRVSYVPFGAPGEYVVAVTYAAKPIGGSPFRIAVRADKGSATGLGLPGARARPSTAPARSGHGTAAGSAAARRALAHAAAARVWVEGGIPDEARHHVWRAAPHVPRGMASGGSVVSAAHRARLTRPGTAGAAGAATTRPAGRPAPTPPLVRPSTASAATTTKRAPAVAAAVPPTKKPPGRRSRPATAKRFAELRVDMVT